MPLDTWHHSIGEPKINSVCKERVINSLAIDIRSHWPHLFAAAANPIKSVIHKINVLTGKGISCGRSAVTFLPLKVRLPSLLPPSNNPKLPENIPAPFKLYSFPAYSITIVPDKRPACLACAITLPTDSMKYSPLNDPVR